MVNAHNKAQARIDRIEIPVQAANQSLSMMRGGTEGNFLAFSWQRVTFALRVPKPDASAARMKEQKPQREVGVRAEASAWDN